MEQESWKKWWEGQLEIAPMQVEQLPLSSITPAVAESEMRPSDWRMRSKDGNFGRGDEAFFSYVGVRVSVPAGREVVSWNQPMTLETGEGVVLLLVDSRRGLFLLKAKQEPGNDPANNYLALSPTLGASLSNLTQAHGGKVPPRAELWQLSEKRVVFTPVDGGRNKKKMTHYGIVEVDASQYPAEERERWFTLEEIREAAAKCIVGDQTLIALGVCLLFG